MVRGCVRVTLGGYMSVPFEDKTIVRRQLDRAGCAVYFIQERAERRVVTREYAEAQVDAGKATLVPMLPGNRNPKPKGPRPATLIKRADEARRKAEFRKQLAIQKEARVQARRAARLLEE